MRWFGRRGSDLHEEMLAHIEMEVRENLERGMSEPEARLAARSKFGNVTAVRAELREARPLFRLETAWEDIRYAVRTLTRAPLLALAVILTLALGIGLTTAVYTLIHAIAFRPRIDKDPKSYVRLLPEHSIDGKKQLGKYQFTLPDFLALDSQVQSLTELTAWQDIRLPQTDGQPLRALLVSRTFFPLYGLMQPRLGRLFTADEYTNEPSVPVVIISAEYWNEAFAADPALLGKTILLNGRPVLVIGIAPPRFAGRFNNANAWLPLAAQPVLGLSGNLLRQPNERWLSVAGRLKPGYTRGQVDAELTAYSVRLDNQYPGRKTTITTTDGSWFAEPGMRQRAIWIIPLIFAALHMVLLIACANVTSLLLSRAAARQRETAIRLSVGASWWRLVRMMLTESILLAVVAGAVGVWLAYLLPEPLMKLMTKGPLPPFSLAPDANVFAYIALISVGAGVVAGLAPAMESLKATPASLMKGLSGIFGGNRAGSRARHVLVALQVAFSMVLLTGGAIFLFAYIEIMAQTPKFDARHVLGARLSRRSPGTYNEIAHHVANVSGVKSVVFTDTVPFQTDSNTMVHARNERTEAPRPAQAISISPGYFGALGISVVAGRVLYDQDSSTAGSATPVVVSEQFGRTLWPGQDPTGKVFEPSQGGAFQVVGVVADATLPQFGKPEVPVFYRPWNPASPGILMLAPFSGDVASTTVAVRTAIRDASPENLVPVQSLQTWLDEAAAIFSTMVQLVGMLGAIALLLSVIGIYGVVGYSVAQRTKEMGIRVAIGASRADIILQVLRSARAAVVAGLTAGLVLSACGAMVLQKALQGLPFTLNIVSPKPYLSVSLLLSLAAVLAMMGPAWRASRADPLIALRNE